MKVRNAHSQHILIGSNLVGPGETIELSDAEYIKLDTPAFQAVISAGRIAVGPFSEKKVSAVIPVESPENLDEKVAELEILESVKASKKRR